MKDATYQHGTSVGMFTITPTDRDHIYVSCGEARFNGVEYRLTAHLYRWSTDGAFHIGERCGKDGGELLPYVRLQNSFYMNRPNVDYNKSYPSDSARKQAISILERNLCLWPSQHIREMEVAELAERESQLAKAQAALDDARKTVQKLEQDVKTWTDACVVQENKVDLLTPSDPNAA